MENATNIIFAHACLNYEILQQCVEAGNQYEQDYFDGMVEGLCWALGAITGEKKEEARMRVARAARPHNKVSLEERDRRVSYYCNCKQAN